MVNTDKFPLRLEKILEYYGLTATALADKIDFNRSTISHLLSGRNKPSLEFVMKILEHFEEVNLDWLVLGKGSFPSAPGLKKTSPQIPVSAKTGQQADLFTKPQEVLKTPIPDEKKLNRVILFFDDGSFEVYEN